MPANEGSKFLAACQNGQLDEAKSLARDLQRSNWTTYRHESTGDTALHLAARQGHLEVVRYLCEDWPQQQQQLFQVDQLRDVTNYDMKRPLHEAAKFARSRVLRYLLDCGAEVDVDALKRGDWTPLMLACTQAGPEALECIETLLTRGANPSLRNKDGWTPLLIACRTGDTKVVRLLIERSSGDRIEDRSNNGRSALHVAAFHARRETLELLLEIKPDLLEARDSAGCTPLIEAVKSLDLGVALRLIELGADVQVLDNIGQNVVHVAASVGNVPVIELVLAKFAALSDAKDHFGVTPLQIAEKNKQAKAVEALLNFHRR